jgi:hypothetical protein
VTVIGSVEALSREKSPSRLIIDLEIDHITANSDEIDREKEKKSEQYEQRLPVARMHGHDRSSGDRCDGIS